MLSVPSGVRVSSEAIAGAPLVGRARTGVARRTCA
jgi:hypothetical protein